MQQLRLFFAIVASCWNYFTIRLYVSIFNCSTEFADRILRDGPNPRAGKKSDQAHPPIYPTKHTTSLEGNYK